MYRSRRYNYEEIVSLWIRPSVVVYSLFVVAPIVCGVFELGPSFVMWFVWASRF